MLRLSLSVAALVLVASTASAQSAPPKAPGKATTKAPAAAEKSHAMDHDRMAMDDHAASGWKELDAYHALMMATWHPAKGKNDLAPARAKAAEMAASAKLLASSVPPKACDTPAMRGAATALSPATTEFAVKAAGKATDAELKTALAALHEQFETLEKGCSAKH